MSGKISTYLTISAIGVGCLAAGICLLVLTRVIDKDPIIGDGKQNIASASNLIRYLVFSCENGPAPAPDMMREPALPFVTAGLLLLTGLADFQSDCLATEHHYLFKILNAIILSLVVGLAASLVWYISRNRIAAWGIVVAFGCITFSSIPRMVNRFNNDPMAMLALLVASAFSYFCDKGTWRSSVGLGSALGFLTLTKAQFLYIAVLPIVAATRSRWKGAILILLSFVIVVAPWIVRNMLLFGETEISVRGRIVAAVRLIMVTKHQNSELSCMAYAFTHPKWRDFIGAITNVKSDDFLRGASCQRFNREICFDMGIERVGCSPFPADVEAMKGGDWCEAVQYFYQGMVLGREIEAGHQQMNELFPFTLNNLTRYIKTLPLFAWRGWGFSGFPIMGIFLTMGLFVSLVTRVWSLTILAIGSHIFHLAFTHNIPRYHAVEFGVMIVSTVYLVDKALVFLHDRWRTKAIHKNVAHHWLKRGPRC